MLPNTCASGGSGRSFDTLEEARPTRSFAPCHCVTPPKGGISKRNANSCSALESVETVLLPSATASYSSMFFSLLQDVKATSCISRLSAPTYQSAHLYHTLLAGLLQVWRGVLY